MYNEEAKQKYLEELGKDYSSGTITQVEETFKATEKYETKLKKDLSNFSEEELFKMFQNMTYSLRTLYKICSIGERYAISVNGLSNGFTNITRELIREWVPDREQTKISYAKMVEWLDQLINATDKFFLYGLFCGIRGKDMTELTCSSIDYVDLNKKTMWLSSLNTDGSVNFKNRIISIDDRLLEYALGSSQAEYYIQTTKTGVRKKVYYRPSPDRLIVKAVMAGPAGDETYTKYVNRAKLKFTTIKNKLGINYTPLDISWAGCAHALKTAAEEEQLVIFSEYDYLKLKKLPEISKQYNKTIDREFIRETLRRYV